MAEILKNCLVPQHHLTKILQQKGLFYFQSDLKWTKMLIFNTSIHILDIAGHLEFDILTKMADILKNCHFPAHQLTIILQQEGLLYFQCDLRWTKIQIFNTSIHILEIGGRLECDILTKMADILKNCLFMHII